MDQRKLSRGKNHKLFPSSLNDGLVMRFNYKYSKRSLFSSATLDLKRSQYIHTELRHTRNRLTQLHAYSVCKFVVCLPSFHIQLQVNWKHQQQQKYNRNVRKYVRICEALFSFYLTCTHRCAVYCWSCLFLLRSLFSRFSYKISCFAAARNT